MTNRTEQVLRVLKQHAEHLNGITSPVEPEDVFYELMSGALVWRDETNNSTAIEMVWALRPVRAYRTSLMLGEPRTELEEFWNEAQSLFPDWVGFRPQRREPFPHLLDIYRRGEVSLTKCLRDFEEQLEFGDAD